MRTGKQDETYLTHSGGLMDILFNIIEQYIVVSQEDALEGATAALHRRGLKGCRKLRGDPIVFAVTRLRISHDVSPWWK
jgi:hypothetical protein